MKNPHPSGRPIRRSEIKRYSKFYIPEDGYLNPRLRDKKISVEAIGFTANFQNDQPDEDE